MLMVYVSTECPAAVETNYSYFSPTFEEFGNMHVALSGVRAVEFAPLITNDTRSEFERIARNNLGSLEEYGNKAVLPNLINGGIYKKVNGVNSFYPHNASAPSFFFPVSQCAPLYPNSAAMLYDLYSEPIRRAAINLALATKRPATTGIIQLVQDTAIHVTRASSLVFYPVYDVKRDANLTSPLGVSLSVFSWDVVLAAAMPTTGQYWLLLAASNGEKFTFSLIDGVICNIGPGDSTADNVPSHLIGNRHTTTFVAGLTWSVTVYPAEELWDMYYSSVPRDICIAAVVGVVAIALVFWLYDYLANGRSRALESLAEGATRVLEDINLAAKPHSFEQELRDVGGISTAPQRPRELVRESIKCLELIGAGAFGRVYKVHRRLHAHI